MELAHTCVDVCVCMWFLARVPAEIGLPGRTVCKELDEAKDKLNNSAFLQGEEGVRR